MIEVQGITKYYGAFKALDDVSFHVDKGEVLGFLGPNGAGKSTTMKVLTTFISASEGTASIGGHDVHVFPQEVRRKIGYLPETPPLYGDMSVEEYLRFSGKARGIRGTELKTRLETVVSDCGLRDKLKARVSELSKGFKQRTGLAQALIHDPEVLILDEPTSGLDPRQIIEIRELIDRLRKDKCIIFSTHILQEVTAVANRLVIINRGKIIADGTVDELATKSVDTQSVRLLVKGADESLGTALRDVENVQFVEHVQGPTGYARFELRVGGGIKSIRGACENISALVAEKGLHTAELSPERLTLEQIFLQLLRKGAPPMEEKKVDDPTVTRRDTGKVPAEEDGEDKTESLNQGKAQLPDDPDATAAATRMVGKPTTSDNYGDAASETAYEAPEAPADTETAKGDPTDTEYSPHPDEPAQKKEGA